MHEQGQAGTAGRFRISGVLAFGAILYCLSGPAVGAAAQPAAAADENPYNAELLRLPPAEQATKLANHLGLWCVGTKPFFMGMTREGRAKGYAYWSLTCAGAASYLIQISPDGKGAATDCSVLKATGSGRECYKTF